MRCQEEGEEEDDPPLVPRLGTRTGSTLLFSTTTRFSDMKQKRNYSFLTSRSIAKTSYTIRSSGVLLQTGRVFLMTFIVVVKSYMEVSNETSDMGSLLSSLLAAKIKVSNQLDCSTHGCSNPTNKVLFFSISCQKLLPFNTFASFLDTMM